MGKKEKRKSGNINMPRTPRSNETAEQLARNSVLIEPLLARFDSSNADFFALVTQGVDRHRLRVFDTHTGTVNNDFSSESEEKFNCLTWGKLYEKDLNKRVDAPSPKKKKKLSLESKQYIKVIALGSQTGSIIIYSISHGSVVKTLIGAHTSVNDFIFTKDSKKGYSCGEDMNIVEWNVDDETVISKWNVDSPTKKFKLALSHDETKLLSVGQSIKMWDLQSKQVLKTFTGHTTSITNVLFSAKDEVFVTSAEHDRFINIWKCQSENSDNGNLDALTLDENIVDLSISKTNTVLAVTESGISYIFKDIATSLSIDTTSQNKKKKRSTLTAGGRIKVLNMDDVSIPILSACFVDEEELDHHITVAIGSTVKPVFEKVVFKNDGTSFQDIILKRDLPTGFLIDESNLAAKNLQETQKSYDDSKAKVIGTKSYEPLDIDISTSKNEDSEDVNKSIKDFGTVDIKSNNNSSQKPEEEQYKFKKSTGHSMQQMLVQALHSNDKQLLLIVLEQTDPEIINNTVKKLPTKYAVSFLEKVITRFQEKPNTGMHILQWVKAVLLFHMDYLMTIPDLTRKLSNFYQTLDARVMVFQKLLNFYGRLDLVMQQVSTRKQDVINTTNDPILSYIESSEEEDDDDSEDEEDDEGKESEMDENESEDEDEEMADVVNEGDDDDDDEENDIEEEETNNIFNNKVVNNYMNISESNSEDDDDDDNDDDDQEEEEEEEEGESDS